MVIILAIAGLLIGSLPGSLAERLPGDLRLGVCSFADSIGAEADTADLRRLIVTADTLDAHLYPQEHVEAGLASLSLSRFYKSRDLLRYALDRLDDAEGTFSGDACYLYWRGRVRRELGTRPPFIAEVMARLVNQDHKELAMQDFRDAAEARPDWLAPAVAMAEISMAPFEGKPGRRDRWREWALGALDRYVRSGGADPHVDVWRSRLLIEAGSFDAANAAALRLRDTPPSGLSELESARSLFAVGESDEATDAYWRAVAGMSDDRVVLEMGRDLRPIFDPQESVEWADPMTGEERADWVRRFWGRRAARDLVSESERIAEHYARLRYVRKNYRRVSEAQSRLAPDRFGRTNDEVLEDRGLIHVRLGEPDQTVPCLRGGNTIYSWIYRGEDGRPLPLHFSPARGVDDWSFASVLPVSCYAVLGSVSPYYNSLWYRLSQSGGVGRLSYTVDERNRSEAAVRYALASDRHRLPLDGFLEFGYEWLFFRGAEPGTIETTLSYGIPIRKLECDDEKESQVCSVEVRASIFDRDTVVARGDAAGQLEPLSKRLWILGHVRMTAASGSWLYRVAAFEPRTEASEGPLRGNWGRGRFAVPELWRRNDSTAVSISSLVLARPGDGDWVRGGHGLALNPLHIYRPDATVELYYEIYGIPVNATYTTEIVLVKADDPPMQALDPPIEWVNELLEKKRSALRLRFDEAGTRHRRTWIERRITLTLRGVGPGRYVLVLAVAPYDEDVTVYRVTPLIVDRDAG
jgi:GWxTD domain-containing protein